MSSIDLVILGIVLEKPQSAYDIQKDVENHHFSRWAKISVPSIYRKVLQLSKQGYLNKAVDAENGRAGKTIYSITEKGKTYFKQLMIAGVSEPISLIFDFNVVIVNLNRLDKQEGVELLAQLKNNLIKSLEIIKGYEAEYANIPLGGKTIFEQQQILCQSLMMWLDDFTAQYQKD